MRLLIIIAAVVIFIVSSLPYLHTVNWTFVWDDTDMVSFYNSRTPPFEPFMEGYWKKQSYGLHCDYYRPISAWSFMLDNIIWGTNPAGYHTTNLLIHAFVSLFAFLAAYRWTKKIGAAMLAGLIFCFHPAHNEVAVWISGRCDLLVPFFLLPAYLLFSRRAKSEGSGKTSAVLTPFLYVLALLSKETAMVFIPLLILDDWASHKKWNLRSIVRDYLPLIVLTGLYLAARTLVTGRMSPTAFHGPEIMSRLMDLPANFMVYIGMITWPHIPFLFEQKVSISPEYMPVWFWGMVLAVFLLVRFRNVSRRVTFLILWTMLPLLLVSDFIPLINRWLSPRFTYLSTIGLCALYGAAGWWLIERSKTGWKRCVAAFTVLLVIGSFAWFTVNSTTTWRSDADMQLTWRNGRQSPLKGLPFLHLK